MALQSKRRQYKINRIGYKDYTQYIHSSYWKNLRAKLLKKPEFQVCRVCNIKKPIVLHHIDYGKMGRETEKVLVPLCLKHHKLIHRFAEEYGEGLRWGSIVYLKRNNKPEPCLVVKNLNFKT